VERMPSNQAECELGNLPGNLVGQHSCERGKPCDRYAQVKTLKVQLVSAQA